MRVFYMQRTKALKTRRKGLGTIHWVLSDDPEFVPRGPFRHRRRARKVLAALRHTEAYQANQRTAARVEAQR